MIITADVFNWDFTVSEDWMLVRHSQNVRSFFSNENTGIERSIQVEILYRGKVVETIAVFQEGIKLNIGITEINFTNTGETKTASITANTDWEITSFPEWCTFTVMVNGIQIQVMQNYSMMQRDGEIEIISGEIIQKIKLIQSGYSWYESFDMIFVEGDSFMMGAQKTNISDTNYDSQLYQIESPVHSVTVSDYYICKFEVTQAQWQAAMGNNPSEIQGENFPITSISWEDAQNFIFKLNTITGKEYSFPTEAEWEFATRGGNLYQGYKFSGSSVLGVCGWLYSKSHSSPNEIETIEPNELNIYDMSGNVREWCNNWFDYYTASAVINSLPFWRGYKN